MITVAVEEGRASEQMLTYGIVGVCPDVHGWGTARIGHCLNEDQAVPDVNEYVTRFVPKTVCRRAVPRDRKSVV